MARITSHHAFEVETYSFKFTIQVSDVQYPSLDANRNEQLVGVVWKET